jgi:hypothetical protein
MGFASVFLDENAENGENDCNMIPGILQCSSIFNHEQKLRDNHSKPISIGAKQKHIQG